MAHRLNRRTVLRGCLGGACVGLGLPLLDAMLNSKGALAAGAALPCRVGVWFWGNGVRPEHWFPSGTDPIWNPAEKQHTQPLADAKLGPYVSLVTGTKTFADPQFAHHEGKNIVLTGSWDFLDGRGDLGYGRSRGPSIDRIAAQQWKGLTRFDSLELGVELGYANKERGNAGHFTSTNGPDSYNPPETSPLAMFNRIFGDAQRGPADVAQKLAQAQKSVLDAVLADANSLSTRLGAGDRARLELHMDSVRSIERRLVEGATSQACALPATKPGAFPAVNGQQPLRDRNQAMSHVLALALACDVTRAFSYQFTVFQTAAVFYDIDVAREEFHEYSHQAGAQDDVRKVSTFAIENLAYTLSVLRDTPEGTGNLLDNCAIMCTTEHTEPMSHSTDDIPMVIAGKASGRLKGGVHYAGKQEKISKAGLTVLRAAGLTVETFGVPGNGEPQTSETFTALESA